jgi:hypothetical protein
MPRIYLKWIDTFITPHPKFPNELYLNRKGERLVWWELNGVRLEENAYIESVHNKIPDETKRYTALQVSSNNAPDRIEFETFDQESFLNASEFRSLDGMWRSPVKSDSSLTGLNTGRDMLRGRFLIIRSIIFPLSNNAIRNIVIKYRSWGRSIAR